MEIEQHGDIALLRMNAGKANAMSPQMIPRLAETLDAVDARALVLTGYGRSFSAGLALPPLLELDRAALREFMMGFGDVILCVFSLPIPVVAAVNGFAIAGGCVLALQADYRLMGAGAGTIGLTEVQLGVGLPAEVIESLRVQVPATSIQPIALEGHLFPPEQARELGLVHEVVSDEELIDRALDRAREAASVPTPGYAQVKRALRAPAVAAIQATRGPQLEAWLDTWFSEQGQQRLRAAAAKLT